MTRGGADSPGLAAPVGRTRAAALALSLPLLCGLGLTVLAWRGLQGTPAEPATQAFVQLQLWALPLWLGAAWWVWRHPRRLSVGWILALAVAMRVGAAQEPPALSSDAWRYLWDGRVQRAGISPWAHPPSGPALAELRDLQVWTQINRPEARTIYPPGAQLFFALVPDSMTVLRGLLILLDAATIALLAAWLAALGQDPGRTLLYAWSPLAIWEVGNAGHLDAAMLPLLVGGLLALQVTRHRTGGALLAGAASLKLYPALLLLAVPRGRRRVAWSAAAAVVAGLYGGYGLVFGGPMWGFLPDYVRSAEDHNIGLRRGLEVLLSPLIRSHARELAFGLCLALMAWAVAQVLRRQASIAGRARDLVGVWLLATPTALHPWYALWLLPPLCAGVRPGWLWLVAALPLSYLKYSLPGEEMPAWVVWLEFGPPLVWAGWYLHRPEAEVAA